MSRVSQNISYDALPPRDYHERSIADRRAAWANKQLPYQIINDNVVRVTLKELCEDFQVYADHLSHGVKTIEIVTGQSALIGRLHNLSKGMSPEAILVLPQLVNESIRRKLNGVCKEFNQTRLNPLSEPPVFYSVEHDSKRFGVLELI